MTGHFSGQDGTLQVKALALTIGDPAGIGPEVVFKALRHIDTDVPIRIYGHRELTFIALEKAGLDTQIGVVSPGDADDVGDPLVFVDVGIGDQIADFEIGAVCLAGGRAALSAIDAAISSIERGAAGAVVTAPINKAAIRLAGATVPGHTELLATRAGLHRYAHDYAMYFDSPSIRVALLTVHIPIREVPASVTAENVSALARLVDRELTELENGRPRIRIAGLNPHAGEGGLFGLEEEMILAGVRDARAHGVDVEGPVPADTLFHSARGRGDVVIAMYHDQGLIPVKTLHFNEAVNVTLGLPYLRASVDHGTAFDIAGRGVADPSAMRYAIEWAIERMNR